MLKVIALVLAIGLVPLGTGGILLKQREHDRAALDHALETHVNVQAAELRAGFERGRTIALLTASNPSFSDFYSAPGGRLAKVAAQGRPVDRLNNALAYLERLYPGAIGEACFIDTGAAENARVVRGLRALPADLSHDESKANFFQPAFAEPLGGVYQSPPYVSPDTGEWVISAATPIPGLDGRKVAIVHFELTIDSFRLAAARVGNGDEVAIVDSRTGAVVLNSRHPQPRGGLLGVPSDRRFASLPGHSGLIDRGGVRVAYERVGGTTANDWTVVATAPRIGGAGFVGIGTLPIVAVLTGLFGLAVAMGRRWSRASVDAETDVLTGLGNRRKLDADLPRVLAGVGDDAPLAILVYDLNGFKAYNDAFGHPAGDALLSLLGRRLGDAAVGCGAAYRLGGDEFCVVARVAPAELRAFAESTSAALAEHGEGFDVTTTCGSVASPLEGVDPQALLRLADERLYARKRNGRFGVGRQTTDVLLQALQERNPELHAHLSDVGELASETARTLGMSSDEVDWVRQAGSLHDLGKVAIPDAILKKPGPLSPDEWDFVRQHTVIGDRILGAAPALAEVAKLVRSSHERWDGSGYPDRIAGEAVPLGARVIAVCDAYHAMVTERSYRFPIGERRALAELRRCAGTQFDPAVVDAFCAVVEARYGAAVAVAV